MNSTLNKALVSIFPNPATETLTIKNQRYNTVIVYDIASKVILTKTNLRAKETIVLSDFDSGIYYMKFNNKTTMQVIKLIVE